MYRTHSFPVVVCIFLCFSPLAKSVSSSSPVATHGACKVLESEHPSFTDTLKNIAVCGGEYTTSNYESACDEGYSVCSDEYLVKQGYPDSSFPGGEKSTYGVSQQIRCNPCKSGRFLAFEPGHQDVYCGNLFDGENFLPYQPSAPDPDTRHVRNSGKAVCNEDCNSADNWNHTLLSKWPTDSSWTAIGEFRYFSIYCCADSSQHCGTQACGIKEAEHPSYTTMERSAALCGGTYSDVIFGGACASNWHICSLNEWDSHYKSDQWPGGLKTSWGEDQINRANACPEVAGHMFYPEAPNSGDFFCGREICSSSRLLFGDGIAMTNTDGKSLSMLPKSLVETHWVSLKDLQPASPTDAFSVMCCKKDPNPPPTPSHSSSSPAHKSSGGSSMKAWQWVLIGVGSSLSLAIIVVFVVVVIIVCIIAVIAAVLIKSNMQSSPHAVDASSPLMNSSYENMNDDDDDGGGGGGGGDNNGEFNSI